MNGTDFYLLRQDMNLTQCELGALMGKHERTVRKYESGERAIPRHVEIFMLCLTTLASNLTLRDYVFRLGGI